jgi:Zn-dependent protease
MECVQCGTGVAASRLSCPACHSLIHAAELKSLAAEAEGAARSGDLRTELATWRRALELLPQDSRQFEQIAGKVDVLSRRVDSAPAGQAKPEKRSGTAWKGGALAGAGLLAWKLKAVIAFALTKGKLLLLGFSKAGTVFTMALSLGVYWAVFGWWLALGLILSIYIHEMGHVAALHRFGIATSFPMFLPGIGAVVRLRQRLANPGEDARVGLAGPIWGLAAAVAAWLGFLASGWPLLAAIARIGAWLNLFNLLPIWQLDGGRAFNALSRPQRLLAAAALAALWVWTREGLLVLLALVAVGRGFGPGVLPGDRKTLLQYLFLIVALSALCLLEVPLPEGSAK